MNNPGFMAKVQEERKYANRLLYIAFRRVIAFLDEWLFYLLLVCLACLGFSPTLIAAVAVLGGSMIVTGYLNIQVLGDALGMHERMFLWPIF